MLRRVPPDSGPVEIICDLHSVPDRDQEAIAVLAKFDAACAGAPGAVVAEVGLGGDIELMAAHALSGVLLYDEVVVGANKGGELEGEREEVVLELVGEELAKHGPDDGEASDGGCYLGAQRHQSFMIHLFPCYCSLN